MIQLGIIGIGNIFKKVYEPLIKEDNGIRLVGGYDPGCTEIPEDLYLFNSLDDFLNSEITHVVILSPNYTHFSYAQKAMAAGKYVLCEKPICGSSRELEILLSYKNGDGELLFPGYNNTFRKDIGILKEILHKRSGLKRIHISWRRNSGVPGIGSWFTKKEYALGGVLTDLGSHLFSVLNYLLPITEYTVVSGEWSTRENARSSWYDARFAGLDDMDVETAVKGSFILDNTIELIFEIDWDADIEKDQVGYIFEFDTENVEYISCFGFSPNRLKPEYPISIRKGSSVENIQGDHKDFEEYKALFSAFLAQDHQDVQVNRNTIGMIEGVYDYLRKQDSF